MVNSVFLQEMVQERDWDERQQALPEARTLGDMTNDWRFEPWEPEENAPTSGVFRSNAGG